MTRREDQGREVAQRVRGAAGVPCEWQAWNSPVLAAARDHGCRVVDGMEMLVQLAMQIFELWTGIAPEETVFQEAVAAALGEVPPPA